MKCRDRAEKLGLTWLSSREGLRGSHLGLEGWVRLRLVSGMKWGYMGKGAKEVMDLFSVWLRDIRILESLLPGLSQY